MEYQDQLYSDWRSSAAKVFWGIVLASIFSVFSNIYDMVSWIGSLSEMAYEHSQTGETSILHSKFFWIGVGAKTLIITGYVLYIVGLTRFAQIQQKESTAHYVYKARTAVILLIITCIISLVFWFVRYIPLIGIFFAFIIWLMYFITYFIMKHAYDGMMMADDFGGRAKLGAKNVRYAAVCQLRLLFMPLVILLVALLYILLAGVSAYGMREEFAKMVMYDSNVIQGGAMMILMPAIIMGIIAFICAIIWSICAFIWPMMGWYRIMSDGPADVMVVVHQDSTEAEMATVIQSPEQQDTVKLTTESDASSSSLNESPQEYEVEVEDTTNKKWYYIGGGLLAVLMVISGIFYYIGSTSIKGTFAGKPINEIFPPIQKVVEVNVETANLRTGPSTESPIALDPMNVQDGEKYVINKGTRLAVMEEVGEWYKLASKDKNGETTYIKKSLCQDLVMGIIPQENVYTDWINKNFECGGDVSVVRQPKGNRLVVSYTHVECDADELLLGVYKDGAYLFYYSLPVTSLVYEEHNTGISINKNPGESIFYEGYYGKDMTRKVKYEWGEDEVLDWAKVPEDKLAEIFSLAILEGVKNVKILTARDIKENQEQMPEEDDGELSGFSYVVDDGEFGLELYVETDEKKVATDIAGGAETLTIIDQGDYDDDGEKEALVYEWGGGNSFEPPYLVYYDKDEQKFKKVEGIEDVFNDSSIKVEEWNGKSSFLATIGLRKDRYVYEYHQLKQVERMTPDVGKRISTITVKQLFGDSEEEEKTATIDINGDGHPDELTFHHNTSHAMNWGKSMLLVRINMGDQNLDMSEGLGVSGSSFSFLESVTNGVPDILCDDAWLHKWNGEKFESEE